MKNESGFCTFTIDLIVKCLYTVKAELKSSAWMLYRIVKFLLLSELVDVKSQLRFQITGLVLVDNVLFCKLIQHRAYLRE